MRTWLTLLVAAALAGCGSDDPKDDGPAGDGDLHLEGSITGPGESGTIEVDAAAPESGADGLSHAAVPVDLATGTIRWTTGATVILSGSYDFELGTLLLSGSGYSFSVTVQDGTASGVYNGPNGPGSFLLVAGENVKIFCGTYAHTSGTDRGVWNVVRVGKHLGGSYSSESGETKGVIEGELDADGVHFSLEPGPAQGSFDGGAVSGTYPEGTFSGSAEACNP